MKLIFNDGKERVLSDAWEAARLIHLSQKLKNKVGFKVRLDEGLSEREQKRQAEALQFYVDHLRIKDL